MPGERAAASAVLKRLVGEAAGKFSLDLVSDKEEFFEVSARRGQVRVRASSVSGLCRGAYQYLKEACHIQVSWSGGDIALPCHLPDFEPKRTVWPNRLRYYLSVCTFGYSTAWWDWPRWEREIDWMAVHGINMPLALVGQESVWQRVFRELGLSDAEIEGHFSGPAYLPWHRLGNLNGFMGPLSQAWIDRQARLQRRILDRQRELGMMPVVPGFSGFVPEGLKRVRPDVELHSAEAWAGFSPTTYVDPRHPMFVEIGSRFVEAYREQFGPVHHYLCETFAEQLPQIASGSDLDYLKAVGEATWKSLHAADADAVWVMQGWPFHFGREFWTPEKGVALFDSVPAGRLIVLDQVTEAYEVWRDQPAVREKGWIHGVVHNYGQNTHLHGDLVGFAKRAWEALRSPDRGNMLGMGMEPEGIDQNPVVYELLTDLMASPERIEISEWIEGYVLSRYGAAPSAIMEAWRLLIEAVYGPETGLTLQYSWRYRPGDQPIVGKVDVTRLGLAVRMLLDSADALGSNRLFVRDLVDIVKTWLGGLADLELNAVLANGHGQERFLTMLSDMDRLLDTLPEHRLSTWIETARASATSADEANLFERNARALITHWGGPFLFDYAVREWSGLIQDFHRERWRLYFEGRRDFAYWEETWARTIRPMTQSRSEYPKEVVLELWDRYRNLEYANELESKITSLGPYSANSDGPSMVLVVDLAQTTVIRGVAICPMFGQGFKGRYSIDLSRDGQTWINIHQADQSTCRGARKVLDFVEARFIRFEILRDLGERTQQFQVLIFEPSNLLDP